MNPILPLLAIIIISLLVFRKTRVPIVGICSTALDQTVRKDANKQKVIALLQEPHSTSSGQVGGLSNSYLREALKVSDRTITRYMDDLEREGKVEQVGETGRNVTYRLK